MSRGTAMLLLGLALTVLAAPPGCPPYQPDQRPSPPGDHRSYTTRWDTTKAFQVWRQERCVQTAA
jgi:hypothetical protein